MIEKIKGIRINGRCFKTDTDFLFFQHPNDRISVVYGKNGSGKSTISEGVVTITHNDIPSDISASFIDEDKRALSLNAETGVFVFNEKYIDENIKIDDDGLGTIVLIGGQVDLQAQIDIQESVVTKAFEELSHLQTEYEKFEDKNNPLSPNYHWSRISGILKQAGGWAEIDSKIKGNRRNSSVTDDVIRDICGLSTTLSLSELQKKFDETNTLLAKVSDSSITYPTQIEQIPFDPDFETKIIELLATKIDEPVLTEREKFILDTIQRGGQRSVESARMDFSSGDIHHCPYCYQHVSDAYKHDLIESIDKVLNKTVDDHKKQLVTIQFPTFTSNYDLFQSLDSNLTKNAIDQLQVCKSLVEQYERLVADKADNIYTPVVVKENGLCGEVKKLNVILSDLERKRVEFNDAANHKNALTKELISLNKSIAHIQTAQLYKDYSKQNKEKIALSNKLKMQQNAISGEREKLAKLQQRKANIGLAIESINISLDYVFFSHGRLSIELHNGKYYLKSNGNDVMPNKVSLGERNIIALCYFFTQIMANQEIKKLYLNETLIVIDDPISSFDFENKVGITSFLRYQADRLIKGNRHSKILFLSHDLETVFGLRKAMEEICQSTKGIAGITPTSCISLELCDKQLKLLTKNRSEYGNLLKRIYHFANEEKPDEGLVIGNEMRRALEAFSTFTYQKSIDKVSCDSNVLAALGTHSIYFENMMYRLVLHGESHYEEQVNSLHDGNNFFQFISETEKIKTAKNVLCFMYFLNPHHLIAYLQSESGAIKNIKKWAEAIPKNQDFKITDSPKKRSIPLYHLPLSAGIGNESLEDSPYSDFETTNEICDFALKVSGDSMEPDVPDESIVLVKMKEVIDDGKIGAFYYNGKVYCKFLIHENGLTKLCSINKSYQPIVVKEDDVAKVYGEVVEIVK